MKRTTGRVISSPSVTAYCRKRRSKTLSHWSRWSMNYDALLIVSFGGPEGMDDVLPFLENVLRGRNVPRERMLAVAHHYEMFGGVSPINQARGSLCAGLKT